MPKWILLENVPGLLSSNDGADFITVLDEFQKLGYVPEINILNSMHFGVPQRRRRVFFLCVHVEHGRKARSPISLPMLAQALFEISAFTLVAATAASTTAPTNWASRYEPCVDGLRRRMTLFAATSPSGWQRLLDDFIDSLQRSASERQDWIALSESAQFDGSEVTDTWSSDSTSTEDESEVLSTVSSLRSSWADLFTLASECITSTSPRLTTDRRTSTCAEISLTIRECIAPLTRSFPLCWNADSSGLTAREVVTSYARRTSSSLFGDMDWLQFWGDVVERAERDSRLADGDPRAAAERAGAVLAAGTRCPRHPAAGTGAGPDVAVASLSGLGSGGPDDNDGQGGRPVSLALNAKRGKRDDGESETFVTAFHATQDPISGDISPAMSKKESGSIAVAYAFDWQQTGSSDRAWITRAGDYAQLSKSRVDAVVTPTVRRLMPVECERLQALPDGWTDFGADSRRYAALGDAVTASVAVWIGKRIIAADP